MLIYLVKDWDVCFLSPFLRLEHRKRHYESRTYSDTEPMKRRSTPHSNQKSKAPIFNIYIWNSIHSVFLVFGKSLEPYSKNSFHIREVMSLSIFYVFRKERRRENGK